MNKKEHLTISGLHKIVEIRASINAKGLSDELKAAFPYIIPVSGGSLPPLVVLFVDRRSIKQLKKLKILTGLLGLWLERVVS
jgi:hypothetical protein